MYILQSSCLVLRLPCHLKNIQPLYRICVVQKSCTNSASSRNVLMKPHTSSPSQAEAPFISINSKAVSLSPSIIIDPPKIIKKAELPPPAKWKEMKTDVTQLGHYYLKLSKFRLTSLVVITSMAGYAMSPAPFDPATFLFCTIGTGLCSSAANSINQYLEVPFDAQMSRTRSRVLVQGNLTPLHAVGFAAAASSLGLLTLYYGTNGLTAALGASNLILYTMIYTPLKRISILNTWIGSIVGAIPPLMGWAACEGSLGSGAFIMAGILYAWQFPHFNALSWNLRPDYSRAGYRMMAVTNPGLCRRTALRYTLAITALSSLAPLLDVTHWYFAALSFPVNAYFMYLAVKFYQESDSKTSRKLFRFSLLHLPLLMGLLLLTKKDWAFTSTSVENKEMKEALRNEDDYLPSSVFENSSNPNFNTIAMSVPVPNVPLHVSVAR